MALLTVGVFFWAARDLPDFQTITDYQPPLVTTVYARDGKILGYLYKEKRFLVPLKGMSPNVPKAFLASEDNAFYQHEGVDLSSIIRAAIKNVMAGGIVQGGSTITQQVIKSLLLTPEKSLARKLKEVILAYRLEKYLTKDEILTIYLNQIYLGSKAYGVEAAARTYFGVHASQLTIAQSAVLAGLPKAPSRFSPYEHPDAAKERQIYVLDQMRRVNWITEEEYQAALKEPLNYKSMPDISWQQGAFYLEEVRRWLVETYGEEKILTAGYHVYTAVDLDHQAAAEKALRRGLVESSKRHGWRGPLMLLPEKAFEPFLISEPVPMEKRKTGEWVKALVVGLEKEAVRVRFGIFSGTIPYSTMGWAKNANPDVELKNRQVGGAYRTLLRPGDVIWASIAAMPVGKSPDWQLRLEQEPDVEGALVSIEPPTGNVVALVGGFDFSRSQFNRATQAARQPGSAFKPIVYSTALDNGFTAASIVLDAPIVFDDATTDTLWKPENFEEIFYGPTLLRTALVKSRNLVTIRVAQKVGIGKIIERAKTLGLVGHFPADLSVCLGSASVTPINLCQAYSAFARGGTTVKPRFVLQVTDAWGKELFASQTEVREAISPQTAYIIASLLKEAVQSGTGSKAKALGRPIAGKTGTTNNEQDGWFMGFTPYLLTGVYVGYDQLKSMGRGETGANTALPVFVDYRTAVEGRYPVQDFPQPAGIVVARVDGKTGLLSTGDSEENYFLPFMEGTQPTSTSPAGEDGGASQGEDLLKQVY